MAMGDTVTITAFSDFEVRFQLNFKKAEVQKRKDANLMTHVRIEFVSADVSPTSGKVDIKPISADAQGDVDVIPITQDDPTFVRMFHAGVVEALDPNLPPPASVTLRVFARLVSSDGKGSNHPSDAELGRLVVKKPVAP